MEEYDAAEKVTAAAEQELTTAVDTVLDSSKGSADAPEPIGASVTSPAENFSMMTILVHCRPAHRRTTLHRR